jgi:two-component system chemotaxis response regulator CheB
VVLHIGRTKSNLPSILSSIGKLPASRANHSEKIRRRHIYVAPPDHHMTVQPRIIHLDRGPMEHFTRPAADPLFRSAAVAYRSRVVGIVLTGGGRDGAEGLLAVKAAGGLTVVQDPVDAVDPSMPNSCLVTSAPDYCIALADIPDLIVRLSHGMNARGNAP